MRLPPFFCGVLWCLLAPSCSPSPQAPARYSPLDYVEIDTDDGWRLRVHGDGSGSLTHRQYPQHHLDYPPLTFSLAPLAGIATHCRDRERPAACHQLRYYRARQDRTRECTCSGEQASTQAFATAIARMQLAVDDGGSERACRMLRRAWLAVR